MAFTNEQLERYSRHIILKEVGAKGQKKLLNASVLIIGAGGLGAPAAMYLAAAGVGTIGIADADEVDLSNLQRQVITHNSRPRQSQSKIRQRNHAGDQSRCQSQYIPQIHHIREHHGYHQRLRLHH